MYYAKSIDIQNCIEEKKQFFEENPGYTLAITSIDIEFYEDDVAKCSFQKQEGWDGGQVISSPAYLSEEKWTRLFDHLGKTNPPWIPKGAISLYLDPNSKRKITRSTSSPASSSAPCSPSYSASRVENEA